MYPQKLVEDVADRAGACGHGRHRSPRAVPDAQAGLTGRWNGLRTAVSRSAGDTASGGGAAHVARSVSRPAGRRTGQTATKRCSRRISTAVRRSVRIGCSLRQRLAAGEHGRWSTSTCPGGTTGSREQPLAVQALCAPAFDPQRCAATFRAEGTGSIHQPDKPGSERSAPPDQHQAQALVTQLVGDGYSSLVVVATAFSTRRRGDGRGCSCHAAHRCRNTVERSLSPPLRTLSANGVHV